MRLVKFTGSHTGRVIYLNPEHVVGVCQNLNTPNQVYVDTTGQLGQYYIKGTHDEVVAKLRGVRE